MRIFMMRAIAFSNICRCCKMTCVEGLTHDYFTTHSLFSQMRSSTSLVVLQLFEGYDLLLHLIHHSLSLEERCRSKKNFCYSWRKLLFVSEIPLLVRNSSQRIESLFLLKGVNSAWKR